MSRNDSGHNVTTVGPAGSAPGVGHVDINAAVVNTPVDRVRWGAVFAGIFAALSLLVVLFVLGSAVGLSSYDRGDSARNFAIGAGWWAAISALLSFAFGGWLAARTAAVRGEGSGVLNGAMVWAVAIPLSLLLFSNAMGSLVGAAGNAAGDVATGNASATEGRDLKLSNVPSDVSNKVQANAPDAEQVRKAAAKGAWGTLLSLLLGLGAAALGGFLGSRHTHRDDDRHRRLATA